MRIACPSCDAVYDVPPDRLRPGRSVRCARCGEHWMPVALVDATPPIPLPPEPDPVAATPAAATADLAFAPEPGPLPPPEFVPLAVPEPAPPARPGLFAPAPMVPRTAEPGDFAPPPVRPRAPAPESGPWLPLALWLLTACILAGGAWVAVVKRESVMRAWPSSERIYALVGLAH